MDMKKILQAMDGISARPVEGADSMARFLRVVKEAEINQPAAIPQPAAAPNVSPAIKPYVHAPGPDDPNFDRYVDLMWRYEFLDNERTGKANLIKVNVGVSDESNAEIDRMKYEAEKLAGPNLAAWEKARIGYQTDPEYIKYSQDMAAKLSAELLEDANVAATLPAVTPIEVPAIPQLPAQDGDLGSGVHVQTNRDGTRTYSDGRGMFTYDAQGKAITYATPEMMGLGQSINLANNQTTRKYNAGPLSTTQTTDAKGNVVSHNTEYDSGLGKIAIGRDAKGITSKSWQGHGEEAKDIVSNKDLYALGNKDRAATYDRAMAQVKGTPVQENSLSKFLSIVRKNDVSILSEAVGDPANVLDQVNSYIKFSSGLYEKSMSSIEIKKGLVLPITFKPLPPSGDSAKLIQTNINSANARLPRELQLSTDQLSDIVGGADKPYAGPTLSEGANPHKVALPVQMAMQHYQQPATKPQPRERLIDKYFVEAETAIIQRTEEKRALYNQYAKTIANRVLMKESAQGVAEGSDPNKLSASVTVDGEFKEFDLTPLIAKNNWVGTPKQVINQADTYLGDFFRKRGSAYSNLKLTYKGMTLNANQVGDVGSPDPEFESIAEAPIAMDPAEPNNPTIHNHEKANSMSLKSRIASARAQLQELAELSESNSLLAWEQICKKAKGGMFMGLEQNLEQIRHGIEELAKQRRKGGTASRGIDKHIGEGKRK